MIELEEEVGQEKEKLIDVREDASFARERDIRPDTAKTKMLLAVPQEDQDLTLMTQETEEEAEDQETVETEIAATTQEIGEIEVAEKTRGPTRQTAEINAHTLQILVTAEKKGKVQDRRQEAPVSIQEDQELQDQLTAETDPQ